MVDMYEKNLEREEEKKEEMTAAKALVELKLLDKRIVKKIAQSKFVSSHKGEETTTNEGISKEDAEKEMKSAKASVVDLINRRKKVKSALVNSNATTYVTIGGKKYTVAEAIERKNSIAYEKEFLEKLNEDFAKAMDRMDKRNEKMELRLEKLLGEMASSEKQVDKNVLETTTTTYKKLHETHLYDPLNIRLLIKDLDEEIDQFEADVDLALSESNARTIIEI